MMETGGQKTDGSRTQPMEMSWDGRPYYSFNVWLKQMFGTKVYKLPLDAGMGCQNRNGTLGYGGCIFCSAGGSGDFTAGSLSVDRVGNFEAWNLPADGFQKMGLAGQIGSGSGVPGRGSTLASRRIVIFGI